MQSKETMLATETEQQPYYHLLEIAPSREEAERSRREWEARAEGLLEADVRFEGWRHVERGEQFLVRTSSSELFRKRGEWIPQPRVYRMADLADPAEFRASTWSPRRWQSRPALMSKDRSGAREYIPGEQFNPEIWDLVPDAWDHEHCCGCGTHICDHPGCGFQDAYYTGDKEEGGWICPPCYQQLVEGWELIQAASTNQRPY